MRFQTPLLCHPTRPGRTRQPRCSTASTGDACSDHAELHRGRLRRVVGRRGRLRRRLASSRRRRRPVAAPGGTTCRTVTSAPAVPAHPCGKLQREAVVPAAEVRDEHPPGAEEPAVDEDPGVGGTREDAVDGPAEDVLAEDRAVEADQHQVHVALAGRRGAIAARHVAADERDRLDRRPVPGGVLQQRLERHPAAPRPARAVDRSAPGRRRRRPGRAGRLQVQGVDRSRRRPPRPRTSSSASRRAARRCRGSATGMQDRKPARRACAPRPPPAPCRTRARPTRRG